METTRSHKAPLIIFLSILVVFGACYFLIKLLGNNYFPAYKGIWSIATSGVIIWLTYSGFKNRQKAGTLTFAYLAASLPFFAIVFIVSKLFVVVSRDELANALFVVQSCIILTCSIILFFAYHHGRISKIVLGIMYAVPTLVLLFVLSLVLLFAGFGKDTVVTSALSPNSVFLAEVIDSDHGATGGSTYVYVARQNFFAKYLVGEFKEAVYYGRWGESFSMTLHWESDYELYINGERYIIS
jgi:hypothetical protein